MPPRMAAPAGAPRQSRRGTVNDDKQLKEVTSASSRCNTSLLFSTVTETARPQSVGAGWCWVTREDSRLARRRGPFSSPFNSITNFRKYNKIMLH